jgi:hypothetical protein
MACSMSSIAGSTRRARRASVSLSIPRQLSEIKRLKLEFRAEIWFTELEGANPSAEGEDADDGGESGETKMVLDVEESFRLVKVEPENKPSKKAFQGDLKSEGFCSGYCLVEFR